MGLLGRIIARVAGTVVDPQAARATGSVEGRLTSIKLDRTLTSGIDADPVRRALAAALVTFAAETRAEIIAEGIETAAELAVLAELGIRYGQGYFLGRPRPLESVRWQPAHRVPSHLLADVSASLTPDTAELLALGRHH
ncbi:MAG: EAL domain-containing protein [Acidimicrobiales bacterium]